MGVAPQPRAWKIEERCWRTECRITGPPQPLRGVELNVGFGSTAAVLGSPCERRLLALQRHLASGEQWRLSVRKRKLVGCYLSYFSGLQPYETSPTRGGPYSQRDGEHEVVVLAGGGAVNVMIR
jgi:hypothetical protein